MLCHFRNCWRIHHLRYLGLFVLLLAGCSRGGTGAPTGGGATKPTQVQLSRAVELTRAQEQTLVYRVETVGVLEAEGQTEIAAGVSGVVDQVLFREGDEVVAGTLLITIDQPRYQAEEQVARSNAERAKTAMDLARDLWERAERLGRTVSEEERIKLRFQLGLADAEARSAQANLALARVRLDRSRVRAPYPGRINKRMVTVGSYLEEKTAIATMADLSRIRLASFVPETAAPTLRLVLAQQERRLLAARLGLCLNALGVSPWSQVVGSVQIQSDYVVSGFDPEFNLLALPGRQFFARIFYMSTVANPDTHMFEAKAEVVGWKPALPPPNPPDLPLLASTGLPSTGFPSTGLPEPSLEKPARPLLHSPDSPLWPGLTARIFFPLRSKSDSCVIPEEAVRASEQGFIVFVPTKQSRPDGKEDWIVRARTLELGFRSAGQVEVLQGLKPHEVIVRRGAEALEDGTPIRFHHWPK